MSRPPQLKDRVQIWTVNAANVADAHLRPLLTGAELARFEAYKHAGARHLAMVSRALLRWALSQAVPGTDPPTWNFQLNEWGRPELTDALADAVGPIRFNMSHTQNRWSETAHGKTVGLVACAMTWGRDLGIDVEPIARVTDTRTLSKRYFAPAEQEALAALPASAHSERFIRYWTLKESYIKARGMGLALRLDQFAFSLSENGDIAIQFVDGFDDDPLSWQFEQRLESNYVLAVGVRRDPSEGDLPITVIQDVRL